jgi:hypothetical protein
MITSLQPLVGASVIAVEKRDFSWFFRFDETHFVMTEGNWRLVGPDGIIVTAEDDGRRFGLSEPVDAAICVKSVLAPLSIQATQVNDRTGDLRLDFGESIYLEFLQMSSGYESWSARTAAGDTFCIGGGEISFFPPK